MVWVWISWGCGMLIKLIIIIIIYCVGKQLLITVFPCMSEHRPYYGEYKCQCGRFWPSRLSWKNCYQICKRCKRQVYPYSQRELRASDSSGTKENVVEHAASLCQRCQQLGQYCGRFRARAGDGAPNRSRSRSAQRYTRNRYLSHVPLEFVDH